MEALITGAVTILLLTGAATAFAQTTTVVGTGTVYFSANMEGAASASEDCEQGLSLCAVMFGRFGPVAVPVVGTTTVPIASSTPAINAMLPITTIDVVRVRLSHTGTTTPISMQIYEFKENQNATTSLDVSQTNPASPYYAPLIATSTNEVLGITDIPGGTVAEFHFPNGVKLAQEKLYAFVLQSAGHVFVWGTNPSISGLFGAQYDPNGRIISWNILFSPALELARISTDPLDSDGDGIYDSLDTDVFAYSNDFTDATTTGSIISRQGQYVSVKDATSTSDGVVLAARLNPGATTTPATISACGGTANIMLTDGDVVTLTCGSVTLDVLAGEVEAELVADNGSLSSVRVSAGNTMTFHPAENTISAAQGNTGVIIATVDGKELTILPIDIKPGSTDNTINLKAGGVVPVAILTTPAFDARQVNPLSITLLGAPVRLKGKSGNAGSLADVDGDGDLDLIVQIENLFPPIEGQTWATLEGTTYNGSAIRGSDSIRIVP